MSIMKVSQPKNMACNICGKSKYRLRSQNDYRVNLKAELEIRQLHDKIDHLLSNQWERLVEIQQIQIDLLSELTRLRNKEKIT
jgi:uncharacterized membrane protein